MGYRGTKATKANGSEKPENLYVKRNNPRFMQCYEYLYTRVVFTNMFSVHTAYCHCCALLQQLARLTLWGVKSQLELRKQSPAAAL